MEDASLEVMNGIYSQFQLAEMVNRTELTTTAVKFVQLTYVYSAKELPTIIAQTLTQLPGAEDWQNGKK